MVNMYGIQGRNLIKRLSCNKKERKKLIVEEVDYIGATAFSFRRCSQQYFGSDLNSRKYQFFKTFFFIKNILHQ